MLDPLQSYFLKKLLLASVQVASKGLWHWKFELQVVHSSGHQCRISALFALPDLQVAFNFFCSSSVVADSSS